MSDLQFSLFFIAILVGYVLVHLRMVRLERHLQELQRLEGIQDRLTGLGQKVEKVERNEAVDLGTVEDELRRIRAGIASMVDATRQMASDLRERAEQPGHVLPTPVNGVETLELSAGEMILSAIETRLLALGYSDVRVVNDLRDVQRDEQFEARVECMKGLIQQKGRVVVRNGAVIDVHLQSVVQAFP